MKLVKSKKANVNYLAKIVNLTEFKPHPNPEVTRMKCAQIDGYTICVGIDEAEGLYVYFPTSCTINPQLLSFANLYRHTEKNANPEKKAGFFEDNGRVKTIKLRGQVSEGFLLPVSILQDFIVSSVNVELTNIEPNVEFDAVEHNGKEFWINKKYIIEKKFSSDSSNKNQKHVKKFNKLIENQFRFHYDTVIAKKEPWCIQPTDLIHLSYKIHGTSGISAYVLCKKPLSFFDKIANILSGKSWNEEVHQYDYIYASRTVVKNIKYNSKVTPGFYGCDVWSKADEFLKPHLIKGMTLYYEIVGFLPNGGYIQKGYDYGCVPPIGNNEYIPEKHFKVRVYRITLTNVDGLVHEFSPMEVKTWCENEGLTPVTTCYYGIAKDLYPDIELNDDWNAKFWERLADDKNFYMEMNSPDCNNKVPHEGLVIKKDDMYSRAWKLKCFAFLRGEAEELDAGESNIEDEA